MLLTRELAGTGVVTSVTGLAAQVCTAFPQVLVCYWASV
jgi:hypothetical protein